MYGRSRINLAQWRVREWAMTAMAFVVICFVLLAAGRGLASGAVGEVLRVRFGGDSEHTRIVLDLSEVTFVDSAGIGILVGCHGKVATAGGKLRMAGLTPRVLNVLRITKVDSILTLDDNVAASLAALSAS